MAVADMVPEPLLRQVVSVLNPRRIILFGSRARGDTHADSDYDLVVVLDDETPDAEVNWRRRYQARRGFSADIVPCREGVLKERARAIGSFAHTVVTEGVVVYERT
jgi:predicted nucleotidyltransferase